MVNGDTPSNEATLSAEFNLLGIEVWMELQALIQPPAGDLAADAERLVARFEDFLGSSDEMEADALLNQAYIYACAARFTDGPRQDLIGSAGDKLHDYGALVNEIGRPFDKVVGEALTNTRNFLTEATQLGHDSGGIDGIV
jgi:hypothetical protein